MAEFFETFIPAPVFDAKKKGGKSVSGFFSAETHGTRF
jgi:hypothetical protein